ncbi:MAG TPA: hypothetical protein EYP14_12810, partial [Planctomycetaceae bacterium]|nr:hypothetical protein [Planctomycetaceae bacterium]
ASRAGLFAAVLGAMVAGVEVVGEVEWSGQQAVAAQPAAAGAFVASVQERLGRQKGVAAILGLPVGDRGAFPVELARTSDLILYFQSADAGQVEHVRQRADDSGLLGRRIFAEVGGWDSVHLADDLADWVVVFPEASKHVPEKELLRVLRPGGVAWRPDGELQKPLPKGTDSWSHVYHGPDNNPLSSDQLARAPYRTQFLAEPLFCPMPEVSVAAGGKVYRAFGHIAHKANQNPMLNTLICVNAYNGTIMWTRKLKEGFMIHRNTMIATPEALYLADDESCKIIDPDTGRVRDEIRVPEGLSDGPVWKWMALVDGVLYALVGGEEVHVHTQPSQTPGLGHWPWGMWAGHDYKNPKTNFGFGRTFLAIQPRTKKILWSYRDDQYIDSRGVCLGSGRIYFYSPGKFLASLDVTTGQIIWRTRDRKLLEAIGPNGPAQLWKTGYSTTSYIKCTDKYLFFAGPQRSRLVVVRAEDGRLLWQREPGNLLLVLRPEAIYAAGPQVGGGEKSGYKIAYETWKILGRLPKRRACTRATGSVDSIFYRASGGTVRLDLVSNTDQHIAPMR